MSRRAEELVAAHDELDRMAEEGDRTASILLLVLLALLAVAAGVGSGAAWGPVLSVALVPGAWATWLGRRERIRLRRRRELERLVEGADTGTAPSQGP
jgi:hypothetical protein